MDVFKPYTFNTPLIEATIIERPNRFIVWAEINGEKVKCHCPVSGRIGGHTINGLKILLSGPYENRGTRYTVEAIAFEAPDSPTFQWVGVNQTKSNAVVEHFLKSGALAAAFPEAGEGTVKREKKLQNSRIDFLINENTFVEVKTPLLKIHAKTKKDIPTKTFKPGNPSERLPVQLKAMTDAIREGYEGAMLVCFQYKNTLSTDLKTQLHENVFPDEDLLRAKTNGLQQWVFETTFTPTGIYFHRLTNTTDYSLEA